MTRWLVILGTIAGCGADSLDAYTITTDKGMVFIKPDSQCLIRCETSTASAWLSSLGKFDFHAPLAFCSGGGDLYRPPEEDCETRCWPIDEEPPEVHEEPPPHNAVGWR